MITIAYIDQPILISLLYLDIIDQRDYHILHYATQGLTLCLFLGLISLMFKLFEKPPDIQNNLKIDNHTYAEPVSRSFACFFSTSIFGLLWTQKMRKTRKWLLVCLVSQIPIMIAFYIIFQLDIGNDSGLIGIVLGGYFFSWISPCYFMYKWATAYNLKMFGYKSERAWKRSKIDRGYFKNIDLDFVCDSSKIPDMKQG